VITDPGPSAAVALADLKPMLALFAQAIAGRAVALRDDDGRAAPAGARDPTPALILPRRVDWFASTRDNRGAYRIAVLREALAMHDDASVHAALAASSVSWRRLFRWLERLRIDAVLARRYPGARADLQRQRAHDLARRHAMPPRRWPLTRAIEALSRHALGDAAAAADHALLLRLHQADALGRRDDAGPLDSARIATRICAELGVPAAARRGGRADASGGTGPAALTLPGGHDGDAADLAPAPLEGAASSLEGISGHAGGPRARLAADGRTLAVWPSTCAAADPHRPSGASDAARAASPRDDGEPPGRRVAIDEWDYRQQRLLPDWCTLFERRQHGSDTLFMARVRHRHAALARRVHRQFAAWRPEGLLRVHGAADGDELELDRVVQALVDRRAGLLDDGSWHLRRDRAQRDVATALLVDTSASTDFVLPDAAAVGPPRPAPSVQADAVYLYDLALALPPTNPRPQRRVIDVAKEALALMCDALHALGDCFAVYTFSGHGRAQVDFHIVKSFDEAVSSRTAAAIAALRPHGATRTGAAIRHATAQLASRPQRQRALIVLTDGYPEDIDYGPLPRDLRYGLEDTAHALREAQALGVQTFCLSIDPAGHDYLRRMCPPRRYGVIGDVAALPDELARVYRALTRAGDSDG